MAIALGAYEPDLFFPASLIIVGAHYLIFVSLYGMRVFAVLSCALVVLGTVGIFLIPDIGAVSGWLGAGVFVIFTPILYLSGTADSRDG